MACEVRTYGGADGDHTGMTNEQPPSLARRVLAGGTTLLLMQGLTVLLSFLAQRIILSTLTKAENGTLFGLRRLVDVVVIVIVDAGLNGIATRWLIQHPDRQQTILASLTLFRVAVWIPATAFCVGSALVSGTDVVSVLGWSAYLMIATRGSLVRYAFELPLRARTQYGLVSSLAVLDTLLFAVGIWLFRDELTPRAVILIFAAAALPGFVILGSIQRWVPFRWTQARWEVMRGMLIDALPVIGTVLLFTLHDKVDGIMLDLFTTPREVGIFGAAYQALTPLTSTVPMTAALALVPAIVQLSSLDMERCRRFAITGLRFITATAIVLATCMSSITSWIIDLVSKGRYADDQSQFFWFLWLVVPIFVVSFIQELNIALGHQRRNMAITGVLAGGTVIVGLVLIPIYQSTGAIVTKMVSVGLAAGVAWTTIHRIVGEPLHLWFVLRLLVGIGVCVLATVVLPTLLPPTIATLAATTVAVAVVFVIGLLRGADITLVYRLLRHRTSG